MITKKQTTDLRKIIGPKHITKILAYFAEQKILSRDGKPYSDIFVSQVFNGRSVNANIEAGIFAFVATIPEERQREIEEKEEIINKAKPYAPRKIIKPGS